ncbi:MAG: cytochrome c [Acidobacteriota bacterium]|nr:cytochrome c [Acidobacteriota bacterium]
MSNPYPRHHARSVGGLFGIGLLLLALSGCDKGREFPAGYQSPPVPYERLASKASQQTGRQLFELHCSQCHGENADGKGTIRRSLSSKPVDFTSLEWRQQVTPEWVYYVILEGRKHTAMAGWGTKLPDEASWDLTAFVLSVTDGRHGPQPPS